MEEKQELNNILLDQDGNDTANLKKYLLIGAGLILLFLIILAIMRALNSDAPSEVLPPEPSVIGDNSKTLFEKVEIKDEKGSSDDEFEQIVKDIKAKAASTKEDANEAVVDVPQNSVQPPKPTPTEPVATQPTTPVKPTVATPEPVKQPTQTATSQKGIYIQVGAFAKLKPDQKLIKQIESKGYSYILYDTKINGKNLKKLLVGPYKSRSVAKQELPKVKSSINKGAFILRVN
jgi:DedD protein